MEIFVGLLLAVILIMASARLAHADYYTVNGNRIREMSVDSLIEECLYYMKNYHEDLWVGYDSAGERLGTIILNVDDDDVDAWGLSESDSLLMVKRFGDAGEVKIDLVRVAENRSAFQQAALIPVQGAELKLRAIQTAELSVKKSNANKNFSLAINFVRVNFQTKY